MNPWQLAWVPDRLFGQRRNARGFDVTAYSDRGAGQNRTVRLRSLLVYRGRWQLLAPRYCAVGRESRRPGNGVVQKREAEPLWKLRWSSPAALLVC